MGVSRAVPAHLRTGLPILVAANVALLVAAHVCKGASTQVDGHAPLGMLKPHVASDDNLISAVRRLADAHAWLMVLVVAGLSGLWPYAKLCATLAVVALTDMDRLSRQRAHDALCWLEVLGKYSFADVVLICFNAVIFEISTGGSYKILFIGTLELHLYMQLKFGSVALIVAVTLSTLLTHWAAYELGPGSAPERKARDLPGSPDEEALALQEEGGRSPRREAFPWAGLAAALASAGGAVLLIVGSAQPSLAVVRSGFLGKLIRPDSDQNLRMSIFSITGSMWDKGKEREDEGAVFFALLFVVLTFVVPLLELLALAGCGLAALLPKTRRAWGRGFNQTAAWLSSFGVVDVYLLVCLAVLFEIKTVVDFNIGDECKPFAPLMNNNFLLGIAGLRFAASSTCFEPRPFLLGGWWFLLVSVVLRTCAWRAASLLAAPKEDALEASTHEA
mmetsp:Transcript_141006/g.438355  ORF Transcript_141006/g.438355 Transcript_141006/m.438355 type:complete len:447 (+) Transcript_141006:59-1399(+)|eukprot:CAMPEP_0204588212 /NCGR_PEP_ID=MMETSP0661-20131031/48499_1 /ASSEMBLY_ACC=CAM_ASM_000606 /TAXON_ID=109239 /ORGANISM="Alexandrium margalefi, Strain AMGDE01CS-322" /LENGTH=446 /DNA_ID=CAMNT_0051598013 /DNA_START=59 /DNA_END=1399 /DNA_ORIENTATION=-